MQLCKIPNVSNTITSTNNASDTAMINSRGLHLIPLIICIKDWSLTRQGLHSTDRNLITIILDNLPISFGILRPNLGLKGTIRRLQYSITYISLTITNTSTPYCNLKRYQHSNVTTSRNRIQKNWIPFLHLLV